MQKMRPATGPHRSSWRSAACLLWLALAAPCTTTALGFIGRSSCVSSRGAAELRTTLGVRERRVSLHRKGPTGGAKPGGGAPKGDFKDPKAMVRALNSKIKRADSATKLISILNENVDASFFDPIHASTAYHKLATFKQRDGSIPSICSEDPSLVKLQARTKTFIKRNEIKPWAFTNVMWSIAVLHGELPFVIKLLPSMVNVFAAQANGMEEQELSNCLWAAAQLKDAAPNVLNIVPALVVRIPGKAEDMIPQALCNCLWASVKLKDDAPGSRFSQLLVGSCAAERCGWRQKC